jgi:hypothetical protein
MFDQNIIGKENNELGSIMISSIDILSLYARLNLRLKLSSTTSQKMAQEY